jgi:hypothetical protein
MAARLSFRHWILVAVVLPQTRWQKAAIAQSARPTLPTHWAKIRGMKRNSFRFKCRSKTAQSRPTHPAIPVTGNVPGSRRLTCPRTRATRPECLRPAVFYGYEPSHSAADPWRRKQGQWAATQNNRRRSATHLRWFKQCRLNFRNALGHGWLSSLSNGLSQQICGK